MLDRINKAEEASVKAKNWHINCPAGSANE